MEPPHLHQHLLHDIQSPGHKHLTRKTLQCGISVATQTSFWLFTGTRAVKHHLPKYCSSTSQYPLKASPGCSFPCWAFHLCYSFLCLSSHLCLERQGREDTGSQLLRCCHRHHRHLHHLAEACCLPSCCIHHDCQGLQGESYFNQVFVRYYIFPTQRWTVQSKVLTILSLKLDN